MSVMHISELTAVVLVWTLNEEVKSLVVTPRFKEGRKWDAIHEIGCYLGFAETVHQGLGLKRVCSDGRDCSTHFLAGDLMRRCVVTTLVLVCVLSSLFSSEEPKIARVIGIGTVIIIAVATKRVYKE